MKVECTQCDWLTSEMRCSKGKNVNHKAGCKYKSPKFDITKIGNMVHVTEEDYQEIREILRKVAEGGQREAGIIRYGLNFIFDINDIQFVAKKVITGVEHLGQKEEWYQEEFWSAKCSFRGAFDEDGDEVKTDFLEHKIAVI